MSEPLLEQGLELMVLGMGTVFVFLTLLVLATGAMSRIVARLPGAAPVEAGARAARAGGDRREELAAAVAAVELHRGRS